MNNQSTFVKVVIWFMVFLMSVGFAALVIAPFAGQSFTGDASGRKATEKLVTEARADIKANDCANEDAKLSSKQVKLCKEALKQLASAYTTLASPEDGAQELPRDGQRNIERAGDAFRRLYVIDKSDDDNAALYAGYLRDTGKPDEALKIWTLLVKANPRNEDYLLQQAGAFQQQQDTDQAIKTLQLYVKRFPDSGQLQTIKDEIQNLKDQQKEAANGGGNAGDLPISVN
jgi:tetratricopeptide (TPR) repeat protein